MKVPKVLRPNTKEPEYRLLKSLEHFLFDLSISQSEVLVVRHNRSGSTLNVKETPSYSTMMSALL